MPSRPSSMTAADRRFLPHAGPAAGPLASDDEAASGASPSAVLLRLRGDLPRHAVAAGASSPIRPGRPSCRRRWRSCCSSRRRSRRRRRRRQGQARSGQAASSQVASNEARAGEAGGAQARARPPRSRSTRKRRCPRRACRCPTSRRARSTRRRRKVAGIGLLAMKDDLQELHGAPVAVQLRTDIKQGPGVGTSIGVGVGAGNEAGVPTRALITSNATGGSGGINTAGLQHEHRRRRPRRPLDDDGRRRDRRRRRRRPGRRRRARPRRRHRQRHRRRRRQRRAAATSPRAAAARRRARSRTCASCSSATRARSTRSTTARCARSPACRARSCSKLTIAPSGKVVDLRIVSSELKTPELEAQAAGAHPPVRLRRQGRRRRWSSTSRSTSCLPEMRRDFISAAMLAAAALLALPLAAQIPPSPAEIAAYRGLHAAAQRGDLMEIERLAAARPALAARDAYGRTPLHVATFARQREAVRALLSGRRGSRRARERPLRRGDDRRRRRRRGDAARAARARRQRQARHQPLRRHGADRRGAPRPRRRGAAADRRRRAARSRQQPALDRADRGDRARRRQARGTRRRWRRCSPPAPARRSPTATARRRCSWRSGRGYAAMVQQLERAGAK